MLRQPRRLLSAGIAIILGVTFNAQYVEHTRHL